MRLTRRTIAKLDPSGAPGQLSALGSPVINGLGGGDPLGDADATPLASLGDTWTIAVDTSATATDGRIYAIAQRPSPPAGGRPSLAFAPSGAFLYSTDGSGAGGLTPVPDTASFSDATGLAVDSQGNTYVAGYYSGTVQKLDPDGNWLESIPLGGDSALPLRSTAPTTSMPPPGRSSCLTRPAPSNRRSPRPAPTRRSPPTPATTTSTSTAATR